LIFFSYNFIRLGLTRAKALQTVRRFPRETSRRSAAPESNTFALLELKKEFDFILSSGYQKGFL